MTQPQPTPLGAGLGAMFRREVRLPELIAAKLAGLTIPLGGGTLTFPSSLTVTMDSRARVIRFSPPATANIGGLIGRANVSGVTLDPTLTKATPMIDGLPDLITIDLRWS
jgi:hypothetical protein